MIRAVSYIVSVLVNLTILLSMCGGVWAQPIDYDCPATAGARVLQVSDDQKIVEVPIHVSSSMADSKMLVEALRIDINWNRGSYPVVDYAPRTILQSRFDGPISVERRTETNLSLGAKVSSAHLEFVSPAISADVGTKKSETRRFNEVPDQELLLSSGTTNRGTGTYFEFKKSSVNTLQGSRELVVAYEVPLSWRGGVLQVTFASNGKQRKFGTFQSEFEFARVFVMPVYLEGDDQARRYAEQFSKSEQLLRRGWSRYEANRNGSTSNQLQKWLTGDRQNNDIPSLWVHHLIQSGSDRAIEKYRSQLPATVAVAANEFVKARQNLNALNR